MPTSDDAPDTVTDHALDHATSEDVEDSAAHGGRAAVGETVATGILAAEREAQARIARRRRLLIGTAVLGLVVAGAVLVVMTVLQQRANTEAQLAANRAEARAALAEAVVERAEDYQGPALATSEDATELRSTLEQFLTETELSDDALALRVETLTGHLREGGDALAELTGREVPEPSDLVNTDAALVVLRELETLRAEAGALADEIPVALNDVELWLGSVRDVNRAVADHVTQVESEEPTSDPDELIELWRGERSALLRLSAAATAADAVPGLEAWAGAHQQYAADLLAWVEEAVALLRDRKLEAYNTRFEELFDTDDPFGFDAAVAAATDRALESPALLQLANLDQRAQLVGEAVDEAEMTTAEELGDDA